MKQIFILIFLFLSTIFATQTPKTFFDEGCKLYDEGKYDLAAQKFLEVTKMGYINSKIYYNIGNCYYKSNDIVNSILFYEKANKLAGNDDDIKNNLGIVRLSVIDRIEEKPQLPFFAYINSIFKDFNIYSAKNNFIFSILLLSILISLLIFISNNKIRLLIKILAPFSVIAVLLFAIISYKAIDRHEQILGIIKPAKISVMSTPDDNPNNTELFSLHQGTKVNIKRTIDNWYEIAISKDKIGWIKKDTLVKI